MTLFQVFMAQLMGSLSQSKVCDKGTNQSTNLSQDTLVYFKHHCPCKLQSIAIKFLSLVRKSRCQISTLYRSLIAWASVYDINHIIITERQAQILHFDTLLTMDIQQTAQLTSLVFNALPLSRCLSYDLSANLFFIPFLFYLILFFNLKMRILCSLAIWLEI